MITKKKFRLRVDMEFEAFDIVQARIIVKEYIKNKFKDDHDKYVFKLQEIFEDKSPKGEIIKLE
ncbi:MAG: hypothetical protein KatS3mg002_0221 [Candidatus Woesearchaeota archaeon]|nr:MAG: hypothetical protein KatS3mg002_0221 [Candidatus Woesearchaeota archaeon]